MSGMSLIVFFVVLSYLYLGFHILFTIRKSRSLSLESIPICEDILTKIKDFIVLLDVDGNIIKVNNRAKEIFGYSDKDIEAKHISEFIENIEDIQNQIGHIRQNHDVSFDNMGLLFKTVDASIIPAQVSIYPIRDKMKHIIGIIIIGQDKTLNKQLKKEIEERKVREFELRESNEKLKELDKMKTDFLSTISHELRTPLTSILGFSKIINKKLKSVILPEQDKNNQKIYKTLLHAIENIDIIIYEGKKLTYLINNILDVAKMEAGKVDWKMQSISIIDVIERALNTMYCEIENKGLKIIKDYEDEKHYIWGDFERLTQVIENLISNAVKFTEKGSITFNILKRRDSLVISIIDTGIGILQEDIEHIFDKFIQVGDTLTNRPEGTGLGLSICKQIIDQHKGSIWVESSINQGSAFSFSLPFVEGDWIDYDKT